MHVYKALLLRQVISAAKPLFGPATFPSLYMLDPCSFPFQDQGNQFIKTDARFFPVRPFSQ